MDSVSRDYYEVIGLPRDCNQSEIDAACLRLGRKYVPGRDSCDPVAAANFAQVKEAYDTLGDPAKRAAYDSTLKASAATAASRRLSSCRTP